MQFDLNMPAQLTGALGPDLLLMGGAMLLAMLFLFKNAPIAYRVMWGAIYAVGFVPLTYVIDRTAYRSFQKRVARK